MTEQRITEEQTHQMVVIHRIFRRGFPELAGIARDLDPGGRARVRAVGTYARFLLNGLHHHHAAEDEFIWPRLQVEAPADAALTERMESQHAAVAAGIAEALAALEGWEGRPDGARLAAALDAVSAALAGHLDEEEEQVLPLIREHLRSEDWEQTGKAAFDGFTNAEKLIALGQMLDVSTPEEARLFLAELPLPIRMLWALTGRRKYTRFMREVRAVAA